MTAAKTPRRAALADPRDSADKAPAPPKTSAPPAAEAAAAERDPIKEASFGRRDTHRDKRRAAGAVTVLCNVPKAFKHINDDRVLTDYPEGVYELPLSVADDTFVIGSGVTKVKK